VTERRYCIISPCRDEAAYARRTLETVANQDEPPTRWIVVDDGSTDETPAILGEYAAKYPFITVLRREDRGFRKVGGGVVDAFYAGYETIDPNDFDYVCKLDLDLDVPPTYFSTLLDRMEAEPRLGTGSGKAYFLHGGELVSEKIGDENSAGMIKLYRTTCFEEIGGFVREVMWDGIDGHRCRMAGWIAASWDDPALRFTHLRPMGTSDRSWLTGRMRHGFGQWFMGTGLVYMTVSAMFRMTRPPYVIGGACMWWGFVRSALRREPRYDDLEFRAFLRRFQWSCMLRGKARATARLNAKQAAVWEARHPRVELRA
jgi:biofilm PGA synthesis N-glycosyltransferase PgaC